MALNTLSVRSYSCEEGDVGVARVCHPGQNYVRLLGEIGEDISFLLCLILLRDLKGAPLASIGSHELSWVVSETLIAYGLLPPVSLISSKNFQEHK